MKSIDAEVEEAEILETEVTGDRRPVRSGKLPVLALWLAVAALVVAAGAGFHSYQSRQSVSADLAALNDRFEAAQDRIDDLAQQLTQVHGSYQIQSQQLAEQKQVLAADRQLLLDKDIKLDQERARLEQVGIEIRAAIQSVHRRIGGDNSHWMAAEAAYLMQIANHRLNLEGDVETAISALETADSRLRDSSDPGWISVREILALEISNLKGVAQADTGGLALKLSGLAGGVEGLKLLGTGLIPVTPAAPVSEKKPAIEERTFDTLLRDGWEGLKSIMVIRHHGQPISALLPPDQQLFIQQDLRLQLEVARVSLLRANQALYDSSLQTAAQLLKAYFDTDDAQTTAFLEQIKALSQVKVRPPLPDISASLIALREQIKNREGN